MAALVAAIMVSCSDAGPTGIPEPHQQALSISITSPTAGFVNGTVAPETPVPLRAAVGGGSPIDVLWSEGSATLGTSLEGSHIFSAGEHTVKVKASSGDGRTAEASVLFTIQPDEEIFGARIVYPREGEVFREDQNIVCQAVLANPRGYEDARLEVEANGIAGSCETGSFVALSQAPAKASGVSVGPNRIIARASAPSRGLMVADTVTFMVEEAPGQILFTNVDDAGNRDFWVVYENDPSTLERLTTTGGEKTWPAFSPDGTKLAYTAKSGGVCYDVYVASRDGSSPRKMSGDNCASGSTRRPIFSPDGTKVAFEGSWRPSGLQEEILTVFIAGVDGSASQRVPLRTCDATFSVRPCINGLQWGIAYGPDGHLYTVVGEVPLDHSVAYAYVVNVVVRVEETSTGELTKIFTGKRYEEGGLEPAVNDVSPDGKWVSAETWGDAIVIFRTDGSEHRILTPEGSGRWPFFCSSSEQVYYTSVTKPNSIRAVNIDGTNDREVISLGSSGIRVFETPRCY